MRNLYEQIMGKIDFQNMDDTIEIKLVLWRRIRGR